MVRDLLRAHELDPGELRVIGVARGPGSYTGLRVGVVTAKVLGRVTGARVIGVPTLEALAAQAPRSAARVLVVMRGYKRRVVVARFRRDAEGVLRSQGEPDLLQAGAVAPGSGEILVTDAAELLGPSLSGADCVHVDGPVAEAVARFAAERAAGGALDETYSLVPVYLRPPSITLKRTP
jgi:tRNA threonylcarbamoyladenosine biosynthesis protein TsaB